MRYGVLTWMILIVALSLSPLKVKAFLGTQGLLHNLGHVFAFLITSVLVCWDAGSTNTRLIRCMGVIAFGIVLEILEVVVYRVRFEWNDVFLDFAGAVLGMATATIVRAKRSST